MTVTSPLAHAIAHMHTLLNCTLSDGYCTTHTTILTGLKHCPTAAQASANLIAEIMPTLRLQLAAEIIEAHYDRGPHLGYSTHDTNHHQEAITDAAAVLSGYATITEDTLDLIAEWPPLPSARPNPSEPAA